MESVSYKHCCSELFVCWPNPSNSPEFGLGLISPGLNRRNPALSLGWPVTELEALTDQLQGLPLAVWSAPRRAQVPKYLHLGTSPPLSED